MKYILLTIALIGTVLCEGSVDEAGKPASQDASQEQTLKCKTLLAAENYTSAQHCVKSKSFINNVVQEIEAEQLSGPLSDISKKYCEEAPQLKKCYKNITEGELEACFSQEQKNTLVTYVNITEEVAKFLCEKEGDKIAMFLASDGRNCFKTKMVELKGCLKGSLVDKFKLGQLPKFQDEECDQLKQIEHCLVVALTTCPDPTTANMTESMFKFIRKTALCTDTLMTKQEKHSDHVAVDGKSNMNAQQSKASDIAVTVATIFTALTTALIA